MTRQILNPLSTAPNDKLGDTPWDYTSKLNAMTDELYGFNRVSEVVDVYQESDFETQDATTITISSGKAYFLRSPIITNKRFVLGGGSVSSILTDAVFLTYTGVGVMFTATLNGGGLFNFRFSCPNAIAFEVQGDGTKGISYSLNVSTVSCIPCAGVANLIDGGILVCDTSLFVGNFASSPIKLLGTGAALQSLDKVNVIGMSAGVSAFDMGTTTNGEIELLNFRASGDPSAFAVSGLPNAGNIDSGGKITVSGGDFTTLTSPLLGVKVSDIKSVYKNNAGLSPSMNAADVYLTGGSETIITGAAGDWQEISTPASIGVSWASSLSERFTVSSAGVITYIDEDDLTISLTGKSTISKTGGGSDILESRIALNWNGTASDSGLQRSGSQTENTKPTTVFVSAIMKLSTGDNIRAIYSNRDGASNIIVSVATIEISG